MMKVALPLITCLFLAACQATPPQAPTWAEFMSEVARMDAEQLQFTREAAMRQYLAEPSDSNRLRAAYVLSRPAAPPQQLAQSREILAEIPAGSDLAAMRDLLDGEIRKSMEMQQARSKNIELQAQVGELQARLGELQAQLKALKAIEEEMAETQQQADGVQQ